MIKREEKHCLDCQHGMKIVGRKGNKNVTECNNPEVDPRFLEKHNWELGELAKKCKHFNSVKLKQRCMVCDTEFEGKKSEWEHWAIGPLEDIPLCSEECVEELQPKLDKQAEEINKNNS